MSFPNKNFLIVGQVVPAKRRVVVDGGEVAHFFPLWQKTEKGGAELITVTVVGNAFMEIHRSESNGDYKCGSGLLQRQTTRVSRTFGANHRESVMHAFWVCAKFYRGG